MKKSDLIKIGVLGVSTVVGYVIALSNKKCKICGQKLEKGERKYLSAKDYLGDSIKFIKYYEKYYSIAPEYLRNDMQLCDKCYMLVKKQVDLIRADERLYNSEKNLIETFPETYLGKIPESKDLEEYSTEFYDCRQDALEEIKKYASAKRKDLVYGITYPCEKVTEANGYIHTIWQAVGKVAKKSLDF